MLYSKFINCFIAINMFATISLNSVHCQSGHEEEMCFPLRRAPSMRSPRGQQGPPGKLGPSGPPGPRGERGEAGKCACDPHEVEQLNRTLQKLQETVGSLSEHLSAIFANPQFVFDNCLVGMKDGRILDGDITASSHHLCCGGLSPARGRLDQRVSSWSAAGNSVGQWIEVDLKTHTFVTGVATQGRYDYSQWVTSYKIAYGNSTTTLQTIQDSNGNDVIFQGNRDHHTAVLNKFPQSITARFFRLIAHTWHGHISLRMDYVYC